MANRKITELTALTTPAADDVIPIVDISETGNATKNKKITVGNLIENLADIDLKLANGTEAAPSLAFTSATSTGLYRSAANELSIATNGGQAIKVEANNKTTIYGDLVVTGGTTTISSTTIDVADKNIQLATGNSSDSAADGGGLTLKGASDKTWNWVDSTDAWTSNQDIDVTTGRVFRIAGTQVLSATTLGAGIVNSSLTSVGTLGSLAVTNAVTAGSLDISGGADIDGTLEADAYTVNGTALNEYIADTVGAMVSSNTETNITVTYQDADNTLDFVIGTLNQDTTGNAATATALETARTIGGVSFNGTANINLPGVNQTGNQNTTGSAATLTTARTIGGVSFDGSANINLPGVNAAGNQNTSGTAAGLSGTPNITVGVVTGGSLDISGSADIDGTLEADAYTVNGTALNEYIADTVGAMVSSNTETNIAVTYNDSDNTLDFVISSYPAASISGTTLASNVVTSSLTSVGTLGSLNVTNTVTANLFSGSGASLTALNADNISSGTINTNRFGNSTISRVHIQDNAINGDKIADSAITSAKILNDSIVNTDINSSAAIDLSKLEVIASNRIVGNDSGNAVPKELTPAEVRTIINVEDGATADQTASDIKTLLNSSGLVNAQIDASAAIAGTKISPDFGSQNVVTTGTLGSDNITINGTKPTITLNDTNNESDYIIQNDDGVFAITDLDNGPVGRLTIASNGQTTISGNCDFSNGIDVTGNIGVSGTVDGVDIAALNTAAARKDGTNMGATTLTVNDADFIVQDSTDSTANFLWRDHSNSQLRIGTANAVVTARSNVMPLADSTYDLGSNGTRWANIYGDTISGNLYGNGSNITVLNASQLSSGTVAAARLDTATTQSAGNNSTKIATTAYTDTAISNLVDSSPSALNTLNELAAALGDDANFSTTVTNSIATKLPLAGGTLDGDVRFNGANGSNYLYWDKSADALTLVNGTITATTFSGSGASLTNVNATTLDSIDSGSFLRSDANDTMSGELTFTTSGHYPIDINGSSNAKIVVRGSSNPYITFRESNTDKGFVQWHSDGYLKLNNAEDSSSIRIKDSFDFSYDDSTWHTVWHAGNDGSGSGLDADTLDGVQGASYLRSDATDSFSGTITGSKLLMGGAISSSSSAVFQANGFIRTGPVGIHSGTTSGAPNENSVNWLTLNSGLRVGSNATSADNLIWHAGNDGSGSGLEADLLDGQEGSYYRNASNLNAGTVATARLGSGTASSSVYLRGDGTWAAVSAGSATTLGGLSASQFLRSDAADSMSAKLTLNQDNDDEKLVLAGTGDPCLLYTSDAADEEDSSKILLRDDIVFSSDGSTLHKIWHAGNGGSGSGLDADTCDGQHLGTGSSPTFNSVYLNDWLRNNTQSEGLYNVATDSHFYSAGNNYWHLNPNSGDVTSGALILYDRYNSTQGNSTGRKGYLYWDSSGFGLLSQDGSWALRSTNTHSDIYGTVRRDGSYTIWDSGNDGSGSGLDADTLDGVQGSNFLRSDEGAGVGIYPDTNNQIDLGQDAKRWRNGFFQQVTLTGKSESPSHDRGAILLQPSASGGQTGINFRSNVNGTSDHGYVWWYDDCNEYQTDSNSSTENGLLLIGAQNDGGSTSNDNVAIEASGHIWLCPGTDDNSYAGNSGPNTGRGRLYFGRRDNRREIDAFPGGTKMLFAQTSAPTGWTKKTNLNDYALRIVSGTAGNWHAGNSFTSKLISTSQIANHTLSTSEIPSHRHWISAATVDDRNGTGTWSNGQMHGLWADQGSYSANDQNYTYGRNSAYTGGGSAHNHNFTFNISVLDLIWAEKDTN